MLLTHVNYSVRVLLPVGGQLLYHCVDYWVIEVKGHWAYYPHARSPSGHHVGLERVSLGDELHGW